MGKLKETVTDNWENYEDLEYGYEASLTDTNGELLAQAEAMLRDMKHRYSICPENVVVKPVDPQKEKFNLMWK